MKQAMRKTETGRFLQTVLLCSIFISAGTVRMRQHVFWDCAAMRRHGRFSRGMISRSSIIRSTAKVRGKSDSADRPWLFLDTRKRRFRVLRGGNEPYRCGAKLYRSNQSIESGEIEAGFRFALVRFSCLICISPVAFPASKKFLSNYLPKILNSI